MSEDQTTTRTFLDRQRDAALQEWARISTRYAAVADIVRGKGRVSVTDVVVIEDGDGTNTGAFIAEITDRTAGALWQGVNDGKRLPMTWYSRQMAILHLLSVRYGDGDDMGASAQYAARVLGIKVEADGV